MKIHLLFTLLMGSAVSQYALADVCKNVNGVPSRVNYDLTTTLTAEQNQVGKTVQLEKNQEANVQVVCPAGTAAYSQIYRSYVSQYPVVETSGNWKYLKLDPDHLEGGMRIVDSAVGATYPPVNNILMGYDGQVKAGQPFHIRNSNLEFQLKIVKPFVGTVNISPKTMFNVYVTTATGDPLSDVVYSIIYSGTVTVPQSCEINAGQTILVNLGALYSGNFSHAGQKPVGIRAKKFSVPVKCSGLDSQVNLTMRLIATPDSHFPQAIASDNADVGVVVETDEGNVLIPNDVQRVAPFITDSAGRANITLQAYPVSTTGETPTEGTFTALASLRVDFD
ncbi:fimbrial protein BcfD [Salmonella enterica]|nr:fimbrial protein BcfD [Salmonella enterica]